MDRRFEAMELSHEAGMQAPRGCPGESYPTKQKWHRNGTVLLEITSGPIPGRSKNTLYALVFLAGPEGFEPPAGGFGVRCSTYWSYGPAPILNYVTL